MLRCVMCLGAEYEGIRGETQTCTCSQMESRGVSLALSIVVLLRLVRVPCPRCLEVLFEVNLLTLDDYILGLSNAATDPFGQFVIETALISFRSWVTWTAVEHAAPELFAFWSSVWQQATPQQRAFLSPVCKQYRQPQYCR